VPWIDRYVNTANLKEMHSGSLPGSQNITLLHRQTRVNVNAKMIQ